MIIAVVLAAGSSVRMGRPKLILPFGGRAMLERALDAYRGARVDEIIVVLGADADLVRKKVRFRGEKVVVNRDFRTGMSSSLRMGIKATGSRAEAAIVGLGDQPFLTSETVDKMVDAYRTAKSAVVIPVYRGRRGNPVLFDRSLFPRIMGIQGDVGAKSVVRDNESSLTEVEVEDRGVVVDVDTPSDYGRHSKMSGSARRTRSQERA